MQFGSVYSLPTDNLRLTLVVDETNHKAQTLAKDFRNRFPDLIQKQPNMIVVFGGDGFILRTIRKHWYKNVPFFGINAGTYGFLLNDVGVLKKGFPKKLNIHHLPLLEVETEDKKGKIRKSLAFNDTWVERSHTQTTRIQVKINGKVRLRKVSGDAILLSTPAGSTAYARAMGAPPLPLDAQALVLAGSSITFPSTFNACNLPLTSKVVFTNIEPDKRPVRGVVDGVAINNVVRLEARISETASVKLAFVSNLDLAEKLAKIQFPK